MDVIMLNGKVCVKNKKVEKNGSFLCLKFSRSITWDNAFPFQSSKEATTCGKDEICIYFKHCQPL